MTASLKAARADACRPNPENGIRMNTSTLDVAQHATSDVPDESSHIVMVPPDQPDKTPQAYVLRARIEGFTVVALCGHEWVPTKDPAPLPVCSKCLDIYQQPGKHRDERDELPSA